MHFDAIVTPERRKFTPFHRKKAIPLQQFFLYSIFLSKLLMKKLLFLMSLMMLLASMGSAKKVHTLGDSTMAPYDESATVTRGWGMYFGQFLTNGWTSVNYAKGGRDSRGGYSELWQTAKTKVDAGDYVLIQFAHNDEKINGMDRDELYQYYVSKGMTTEASTLDSRGTTPSTTYKQWLGKIVDEVKAKGAIPVLVAPVCRSYFGSDGKIRRNGRHDLGDSFSLLITDGVKEKQSIAASDHTMDYVYHMKQLATEKEVAFVDLTTATAAFYESYGDAKCHEQLFDGQGSTHFNTTGALLVARLCAQLMKEQGILSDDIVVPTDLSVSPATADMGEAYKGQTLTKELTINGFGLSPADGTITITASEGIDVSVDKKNWAPTASVAYKNGTLVQSFYARVVLTAAGSYSGEVTVALGEKQIKVPLTAKAVELGGGTAFRAFWPLLSDDQCTAEGAVTVLDERWSNMVVKNYAALKTDGTTWPEGAVSDANRKTQRNVIVGEQWTKAEDDDPDRYISFGVQAPEGHTLKVNNISMLVGGAGGSGMMCHVYYSTNGFQTRTTLFAPTSMAGNTMYEVKAQPVVTLDGGQQLEVRVYPWYNSDATGKTICLADVCISGVTEGEAGLENEPVSVTFPFHEGTEGQTAVFGPDEKMGAYFKTSYVALGSSLAYKGVGSVGQQTLFQPAQQDGSANNDNAVNFYFIPKKGMVFTPTKVSFSMTRYGTDGGKVDASWVATDGSVTAIASALTPNRNNKTPNVTEVSQTVSGANGSDGLCGLRLNLYSLGNTKQVGFGDIVIEGTLLGAPQDTRQCRLNVSLADENAGLLTVTPGAELFDEGDEVKLSVAENFGYHFTGWADADGNIVSTENPFLFNIDGDTRLTATFSKANTYALDLTLTNGARANLVDIQPAGVIIDGRCMYEEGTDVKLTAINNRILTFVGWGDDTTDMERTVRMDGDTRITANFSAADYIVGWDLYDDNPKSERAADYKADSENAGLLSLRNAAGETTGWLANGVAVGRMNGKYGARVWRPLTGNYYFETSFSSKGYENLKLVASVGDDYNAHSVIYAQYSTDGGQTFQTFGTYNLPNRGWDTQEFDLPADAAGVDRLFIRFMPDYDSPMTGVESANDGTAIADIFVLADAIGAANEVATLVSVNPADKATGVSRNGSIILSFDNKVKAGEGKAILTFHLSPLTSEEIQPIISGRSAIFKFSGLAYNTAYTFNMPEGVLVSRSGKPVAAATVSFTTMERQQPEARLYDAVVAQDGSGDYKTLQEAIDNAPARRAKPWLIFVKNGRYNEHIDIPATKPHLHIIGQQRDKTVVYDNRLCGGDNAYSVDPGATVVVKGSDTFFENITLENSYGYEKLAGPQALALNTVADRVCLNNVALLSYQDTWITSSSSTARHYIKNSLIEGAVDFIYNNGNVYLDGDTIQINRPSGGYIVAPRHTADTRWGYVFQNCVIRPRRDINVTDVWLGRPWHDQPKTVFINTQTFINILAKGWYNTMGGLPALWAEYNTVDKDGNPVDLSQRETYYYYTDNNGQKHEVTGVKNTLTAEEAAEYTIKNVCGGNDNWQPDLMCDACDAPIVKGEGSQLSWSAVPYAVCYVVTRNGEVVGFTTETTFAGYTTADTWQVQAVNENGGLSAYGTANATTAIYDQRSMVNDQCSMLFMLDGRHANNSSKGFLIYHDANGITRKIIR